MSYPSRGGIPCCRGINKPRHIWRGFILFQRHLFFSRLVSRITQKVMGEFARNLGNTYVDYGLEQSTVD